MRRVLSCLILIALAGMSAAHAQVPTPPRPSADSVFARARQLVVNGNGAAGRVLVDSVVAATEPDTPAYAEALYWRATLAAASSDAADAERDYRRIVIEYPLSPRTGDALLQLAQLEIARGDRAAAATHLERFLLENPKSPDEQRAAILLVKVAFEQNNLVRACIALHHTLSEVPTTAVELRNQLEYYSPRCIGVDTTRAGQAAAAAAAAAPTLTAAARDSAHRDSLARAHAPKAAPKGRFTLQVAAYSQRVDADLLAKKLKARGLDVRVIGETTLFRVRIGRYATRSAAVAAAAELKAKKIIVTVKEAGAEDP